MKVTIEFEDNNTVFTVDLFKLCNRLGITEEQIKHEVQDLISKNG